ncbi:MAG: hypothetical protein LKM39_11810 [Chiayiivirga sp.]|jgi:hypothetical protein|nr:hypothetical protein [Chiayiivirga sp.]
MGLKQPKTFVQFEGMDDELRNGLWNVYTRRIVDAPQFDCDRFTRLLWEHFFKKPIDSRPIRHNGFSFDYRQVLKDVRDFFFGSSWNEVYEFLEFVLRASKGNSDLRKDMQYVLSRENSGYRLVDDQFVPISDEIELREVEQAASEKYASVAAHIRAAIDHLSDKTNPDYRNSIKESISAVESIAKVITGETKATLSDALKILEKRGTLHPALKEAFSKLYGYTSDADGIRHALVDEDKLTQADARYFLVVCSAFINLLKAQAN